MSYILDALKKSDQQRRRGVPPTLLTPQAVAVLPKRRVSMSHVVLAAILIGAGIVIGSLRPWQAGQPAPATESAASIASIPLEAKPRPSLAPIPMRSQAAGKSEKNVPVRKTTAVARSVPTPAAGAIEKQASASAKPETSTATPATPREAVAVIPKETAKPVPATSDGAGPGDVAQAQKVLTIAELPESIQQEIPKMSISVHAYSRVTKERLVGINDRVLREGEYPAPGLMLEQITPDGVIMSYKGYRFRRGVH